MEAGGAGDEVGIYGRQHINIDERERVAFDIPETRLRNRWATIRILVVIKAARSWRSYGPRRRGGYIACTQALSGKRLSKMNDFYI